MNGFPPKRETPDIKSSYWCQIIKKAEDDCLWFFYAVDFVNNIIFRLLFLKSRSKHANIFLLSANNF